MAIPDKAVAYPSSADPADKVEWIAECAGRILEAGETIDTYALVLDSAAVALGIEILDSGAYVPILVNSDTSVQYWLEVPDPADRDDAAFSVGVKVGVQIEIVTDSTPPRRRQRTWVTELVQQ